MLLVHYGSWKFDLNKFEKIKNTTWCKPDGGLWTSPMNVQYDWKEFCVSENFNREMLHSRMVLKLCSKKILVIDGLKDMQKHFKWDEYLRLGTFKYYRPDFEELAKKYDAIHLTWKGQCETRRSQPHNLYGWDVETVLVLNAKKIKQVYPKRYEHKDLQRKNKKR